MTREQESAIRDIVGTAEYDEAMDDLTPTLGIVMPEGALYTSEQYEALMNAPRVSVYVTDPHDRDADYMWVGYNCMGFNIKCNEVVDLPEPIAEMLKNNQDSMKIYHRKSNLLIRSMDRRNAVPWKGKLANAG